MKNDRQEDLARSKTELEQLKGENGRLETEIKKAKLVANNYHEKLKQTDSQSATVSKKLEATKKKLQDAEKKEVTVRNSLLGILIKFFIFRTF